MDQWLFVPIEMGSTVDIYLWKGIAATHPDKIAYTIYWNCDFNSENVIFGNIVILNNVAQTAIYYWKHS